MVPRVGINNFVDFHKVREKLLQGKHTIVYNSLTTEGKQHEIIASLLNTNMFLHQSESDKIIVFDENDKRWRDIEVKTIVSMESFDEKD